MRFNFKYSIYVFLFFIFITSLSAADKTEINVMPVPAKYEMLDGVFKLDNNFGITIKGNPDERLYNYATRVLRRLSGRTGLFFKQDVITKQSANQNNLFVIDCKKNGKVVLGEDESYELKINYNIITLTAQNDLGVMRGLETFLQLLTNDKDGYYFPAVNIQDKPRFKWRGLMIDVARHFMPVDVIKRNIDALAMVKMNVLHLHLSDNQSVRVESKLFPQIQQNCTDSDFFTQEQIKDIVLYAANRGIRVIPEFDIPWHSTAWFAALPKLASAPGPYTLERNWGVFDPVFNPAINETYDFFDKFFGEMAKLFPDEYFHIGGDEGTPKHWNENAQIQAFMKKNKLADIQAMHNYFNLKILNILTKHNKKMIGWDEILQPEMPTNIVIQSWRGQKTLIESAKKGYMGILSAGYYIDLIQPTDYHYLNNPVPDSVKLQPDELERILGGEATMWSELVTPENVDSRIWPRTAAIAERFWSPSSVNDINNMYHRLDKINFLLEEVGICNIKNQDMMLRRLCGNNNTNALKTLLEVIEPVKGYTRHSQGVKYTTYTPYTRVVDAALPDVKTARDFKNKVDEYLTTQDVYILKDLTELLTTLKNNHLEVKKLIALSPILKEIEPLSLNLSKLSSAALDVIRLLQDGNTLSAAQKTEMLKTVESSKKPYGQTEIMIVSSVEKLVNEAGK